MAQTSKRKAQPRVLPPDELALYRGCLAVLHEWGTVAVHHISILLGESRNKVWRYLQRLEAQGLVRDLGDLGVPLDHPLRGRWYAPSKQEVPEALRPPAPRTMILHRQKDRAHVGLHAFETAGGYHVEEHPAWAVECVSWIVRCLKLDRNIPLNIMGEWRLRKELGWYDPTRPKHHPDPVFTMVPDAAITAGGEKQVDFRVQVTVKLQTRERYEEAFGRLRDASVPILYVVIHPDTRKFLEDRLSGLGRTAVILYGEEQALESFYQGL